VRRAIWYTVATAGVLSVAMTVGARAQDIENGVGVICDSPRQVEQVIAIGHDFRDAVAEINAINKMPVCGCVSICSPCSAAAKGRGEEATAVPVYCSVDAPISGIIVPTCPRGANSRFRSST
jgi:hypothetical protein